MLQSDPKAQLVDVRTDGGVELCRPARPLRRWTASPLRRVAELSHHGGQSGFRRARPARRWPRRARDKTAPMLFLCRSGARSRAAAIAMTRAGFTQAFNVAGGFEGDLDGERHRGHDNGWKAAGLPWRQA